MKTIITILAMLTLTCTSCKKNRTCQCIHTDGEVTTSNIVNETKKGAKNICSAKSNEYKSCELK